MSKRNRNVFDNDRRMELRMRVAIKKMRQSEVVDPSTLPLLALPEVSQSASQPVPPSHPVVSKSSSAATLSMKV